MHDDVVRAVAAWAIGSVLVALAFTVLGLTWWWTFKRERFGAFHLVVRAGLGIVGCTLLWLGLMLVGLGTENFLGSLLGRWTGASMVPMLWIALEFLARDQALVAGLAERDLDTRLGWIWGRLLWGVAKLALVLSGYVVLWATFGV